MGHPFDHDFSSYRIIHFGLNFNTPWCIFTCGDKAYTVDFQSKKHSTPMLKIKAHYSDLRQHVKTDCTYAVYCADAVIT